MQWHYAPRAHRVSQPLESTFGGWRILLSMWVLPLRVPHRACLACESPAFADIRPGSYMCWICRWCMCARHSLEVTWLLLDAPAAGLAAGGNPACWVGGYTFELCCGGPRGDSRCFDAGYTYETCCVPPHAMLQWLHRLISGVLQVLFGGTLGLSILGFGLYARARVLEARMGGADGGWQLMVSVAWFATLSSHQFGRIAAVVGVAVALRELFLTLTPLSKEVAQRMGERILEVNGSGS
eukprot:gnl/TRDRNA2_/TRDRNA2_156872_c0_seq3.p1 gnl/TRDRNA2_/TRDRNA2_156872_c0~~gnl/TRDRNA2_/TRDRNA2_156872_c0_seq3.p1  ORF type:complete len:239 (-),score=25.27 gnl/TRDRNA2_/TRDRNA2_156872_c0_seq3:146-862(-)